MYEGFLTNDIYATHLWAGGIGQTQKFGRAHSGGPAVKYHEKGAS